MDLEKFLQTKLGVREEEAKRIIACLNEYKQIYSHHHPHKEQSEHQNVLEMICESQEEIQKVNYDLSQIHCNGCHKHCSISSFGCNRGKYVKEELMKLKQN